MISINIHKDELSITSNFDYMKLAENDFLIYRGEMQLLRAVLKENTLTILVKRGISISFTLMQKIKTKIFVMDNAHCCASMSGEMFGIYLHVNNELRRL